MPNSLHGAFVAGLGMLFINMDFPVNDDRHLLLQFFIHFRFISEEFWLNFINFIKFFVQSEDLLIKIAWNSMPGTKQVEWTTVLICLTIQTCHDRCQ